MAEKTIKARMDDGAAVCVIDKYPDCCPICHNKLTPQIEFARLNRKGLQLVFLCPNEDCVQLFISYYSTDTLNIRLPEIYFYRGSLPWKIKECLFRESIKKISEMFIRVYNEANEAERRGLRSICGAGYRRALEFLIKDYLVSEKQVSVEQVKEEPLGRCINDYVDDVRIKDCAKRAAWLGNDQTHYYMKWVDRDLDDLKTLINLTINWMDSEFMTKQYKTDMPKNK